jgi:hypothetical protein
METTFNQAVHEIADEIAELVISKQLDYGTGNILKSPAGAEAGIVVRVGDKLNRLWNLLVSKREPKNEPVEDSWKDVAGYALVALMVRRGKFELPLE